MADQPTVYELAPMALSLAGMACIAVGGILVLSSYYRLGITGTYLGDRMGIYLPARVESFPFSVMEHPMYTGATLCFLGQALRTGSPAGVFLTVVVAIVYAIAESIEGPFTAMIYAKRAEDAKAAQGKAE